MPVPGSSKARATQRGEEDGKANAENDTKTKGERESGREDSERQKYTAFVYRKMLVLKRN